MTRPIKVRDPLSSRISPVVFTGTTEDKVATKPHMFNRQCRKLQPCQWSITYPVQCLFTWWKNKLTMAKARQHVHQFPMGYAWRHNSRPMHIFRVARIKRRLGVPAAQLVGRRSWRRGQTAGGGSILRWSTGKPQVVTHRKATGAGEKKKLGSNEGSGQPSSYRPVPTGWWCGQSCNVPNF